MNDLLLSILNVDLTKFGGDLSMSLTEVLPEVESLSRLDKIRLMQFLARDLERDDGGLIRSGQSYQLPSPDQSFRAAAALQALENDKGQP